MKDGIVLMYCKDDEIYPVAITEDEHNMISTMVATICNPLKVLRKSQGKALDLRGELKNE